MIAMVNLVPLFLRGQTSVLVDRLTGLPLYTYYIAYHWIRRVAIIQGILYAILALVSSKTVNMRALLGIIISIISSFKAGYSNFM